MAIGAVSLCMVSAGCGRDDTQSAPPAPAVDVAAHKAEVERWRAERDARLRRPDGWLTLIALAWLREGENPFGSDPHGVVVLPEGKAPARAGTFVVAGGKVEVRVEPGVALTAAGEEIEVKELQTDAQGEPTMLQLGSLTLYVIERRGRLAARVKDGESPLLASFPGMEYWPIDPAHRVVARFEPKPPGATIEVPNIMGGVDAEAAPGTAVFTLAGRELRLDPIIERGSDELFFIFGDETNGEETYGGGRFLYAAMPDAQGRVVLDFNQAYNPPCVFTDYATCPLPPPGNDLPVAVEAGEMAYHGPGGHA